MLVDYDELAKKNTKLWTALLDVPDLSIESLSAIGADGEFTLVPDELLYVFRMAKEFQDKKERNAKAQKIGIEAAQKRGVKFGREHKKKPENWDVFYQEFTNGKISLRELSRQTGISHSTIRNWIKSGYA